MQVLSYNESADLAFIDQRFPFCFSKGFSDFITTFKKNKFIFLFDGNLITPLEIRIHKIITTAQFHFAPLTLNGEEANEEQEKLFLENCIKHISSTKLAHRILQPCNYALFNTVPSGSRHSGFGTYQVNLIGKTEKELLENMQARYRTAIRQVEKTNFTIKESVSELSAFAELHRTTMLRTNSYFEPEAELLAMEKHMGSMVLVRNIYIDGVINGGLFILYTKFGAYYMHGASSDLPGAQGAIKYLHYDTMRKLATQQVKMYDFVGARLSNVEGTKLEGIQNFKKRFGSELKKGWLWKQDIDVKKCKMFDFALRTKNLIKGVKGPEDIIEQELKK